MLATLFTMKEGTPKKVEAGTTSDRTADWLRCYYDAWNRRDWEWIGAMLTADVEWSNTARDERIKGAGAVIASFRSTMEGFPTAMIDLRSVHITLREGGGAVVVAECGIKTSAEASLVRTPTFCEVLELRGGRCAKGTTYADSVRLLMDMSQTASAVAA